MSGHPHIAGLRLAVPGAGGFEGQSIANPDFVRINSRALQVIDMQKRIRAAAVDRDKSEATVGIPHFQFAGAHPISLFSAPISTGRQTTR
jgi:hypothetical protein